MMVQRSLGAARKTGTGRLMALGLAALALSGCVSDQGTAMRSGAASQAKAGTYAVSVAGGSYEASLVPGRAGKGLGAKGARPVAGYEVSVIRLGGRLAAHEGALAKKVMRSGCKEAGGRVNETALGRYDRAGLWRFAGGCA